ncbi:hypothetical protein LCGC14_2639160, partial [marine sediment metagenome]
GKSDSKGLGALPLHVDPRKLYKLLTACKVSNGDIVELIAGESGGMVVEIGERTFQLPIADPNNWPEQPELSGPVATVEVDDIEPLSYTARAMSTDETRYNMRGVYFDSDCLVATNTHILIRAPHPKGSQKPMIVPAAVVQALLNTKPASYAVSAFEQYTVFETPDGHKIIGRNSEGQFPNYKQVIPTDTATASITGPSENWVETMKTVGAIVEGRVKGFKLSVTPKEPLVFESSDGEGAEYSEKIKWATVTGEVKPIGFNTEYVLTCLQGETATLSLGAGPNDPARITSERDGYLAVIMPMRV